MHLLCCITIWPIFELKTRPKELLVYLPLDILLPSTYLGSLGSVATSWVVSIKMEMIILLIYPIHFQVYQWSNKYYTPMQENSCLKLPQISNQLWCLKNELNLNMDFSFDHQMSLRKSKCLYSNNCLCFLRHAVPFAMSHFGHFKEEIWQ